MRANEARTNRVARGSAATQLVRWLDELGRMSDEPGRLTRMFLSPAMRRANQRVGTWMREGGITVRVDSVGNLVGRLEGTAPRAKTLVLGSHLDTVRDAGRFDGALGVLLPIVALAELRRRGTRLPFAVEIVGFAEEEGIRFSSAYLGSKGFAGQLQLADLALRDSDGETLRAALDRFGERRFSLPKSAHRPRDLLGYCEVHIEQGPVLEERELAVGIVSAIAGQTRALVTFQGKAGHAGTTPMTLRRDALAGAAEFVLAVEKLARQRAGLVATVGTLRVFPDSPNVIPGVVTLSVDVRHARDATRDSALPALIARSLQISRRRGLHVSWQQTQDQNAVACSHELSRLLNKSVRAVQGTSLSLVSGAGHDAVIMSALTPVAMLFVRCRDGLSHHPDEYASPADIHVALQVMIDFLGRLAKDYSLR